MNAETKTYADQQIAETPNMRLRFACMLAQHGFHFAPARPGETHGDIGWNSDATADPEKIKGWLASGYQLVMVAKFGKCAALDVDDWQGCLDAGFDPKWIEGEFKVNTPSGGFHIYLPWHAAFDAFTGAKADAFGPNDSVRPMAELKLNNASIAAPGSFRRASDDGRKREGFYIPDGGKAIPCPHAPALAGWFKSHGKAKDTPRYTGSKEKWEFHPDFNTDGFLEWNETSLADGDTEGMHEDSYDLVLAECPLCHKPARPNSTQTNFVTKFKLGGNGYGFVCCACDVNTRQEFEVRMAEEYPDWAPWPDPIYRHDDLNLLLADGAKAGLEVVEVVNGPDPEPESGTGKAIGAEQCPPEIHGTTSIEAGPPPEEPAPEPKERDNTIILAEREGVNEDGDPCNIKMTGVLASNVTTEKLEWLWEQRIPAGKITWLAGKPDCGKSLVLLDLIARTTTGRDWPDGAKNTVGPKDVLLAASEDGLGDTVVPRLMAAGADLARVRILQRMVEKKPTEDRARRRQLQLARDTQMLRLMLRNNPEIVMVAIDPITGYFGDADPNKDKEIRPVMEAINRACENSGAAFVAVVHHNKRTDVDALQKILGASSVAGVSRAAWGFSRDPEDKETLRMSRIKGNLSKKRSGMKYHIADRTVPMADGSESTLPFVEWAGECPEDADELQAQDREKSRNGEMTAVGKAKAWLKWRLKDGPVESNALFKEASDAGISRASLFRAKDMEDSELAPCHKSGTQWFWRLATPEGEMARMIAGMGKTPK
jgi:hypothetical protein